MSSILGSFKNTNQLQHAQGFKVVMIPYTDIKEAEINRTLHHIEDLAEDIHNDGLEQPLVVRKIDHEQYRYELVAGHRRFNAICHNIKNGDTTYQSIPCVIKNYEDEEEAHRRKLMNNLNIDGYSNGEKLEAIEWLIDYYKRKKEEKGTEMPGRVRDLVASAAGLKPTQVGTYQKVIDHAVPEVKEKISAGELPINAAAELSSLTDEEQMMFIQEHDGNITLKTVNEYKETLSTDVTEIDTAEDDIDELYESYEYLDEDEENEIEAEENYVQNTQFGVEHGKDTILSCISRISYNFELLEQKMNCSEFRDEQIELKKAIESFSNLKIILGL